MLLGQTLMQQFLLKIGTIFGIFNKTSLLQTKLGHQKLGHGGGGEARNWTFFWKCRNWRKKHNFLQRSMVIGAVDYFGTDGKISLGAFGVVPKS